MSNKTLRKILPFFDPSELPKNPFIFCVSSRRAGKSTLICDLLLNYFQDVDVVIGLMGNAHTAQQYIEKGAIPEKYCHKSYSPNILKKWFKKSQKLLKQGKKIPSVLFVCDDVLVLQAESGKKTTRQDPYLNKLATMGRHFNASKLEYRITVCQELRRSVRKP